MKTEIDEKIIKEYAIKGLTNEIQELDRKIRKGCKYLDERANGNKVDKSPLTDYELNAKVNELIKEMKKLEDMKNQIKWELID